MVDIKEGLQVLHWAMGNSMAEVCIPTDCAIFVQGLRNSEVADAILQLQMLVTTADASLQIVGFLLFMYICLFVLLKWLELKLKLLMTLVGQLCYRF